VVLTCLPLLLCMQVSDWLDFIVGRVNAHPNQMPRERPLGKKRSKKKRGAGATTEEDGEGQDLYNSGSGRVSTTGLPCLPAPAQRWGAGAAWWSTRILKALCCV
jgi:hypothetical protein